MRSLAATIEATTDLSEILDHLDRVLDAALDADGERPVIEVERFDLSMVDLAVIERLRTSPQAATQAVAMANAVQRTARAEAAVNPTLLGLQKRVEAAIEAYQQGAKDLGAFLDDVKKLAAEAQAAQARAAAEGLTRRELAVFDVIAAELGETAAGKREAVKTGVRALSVALPEALGLDWAGTDQGRSRVEVAIRDALDAALGDLSDGDRMRLRRAVFRYVYEHGFDRG